MWVRLSGRDLEPMLVEFANVTHVTSRAGGGSTIYFKSEATNDKGETKQRALAVRETVPEISKALGATEAIISSGRGNTSSRIKVAGARG